MLVMMQMLLHEPKSHDTLHFDHFDLMNAVMLLTMPLTSLHASAGNSGIV